MPSLPERALLHELYHTVAFQLVCCHIYFHLLWKHALLFRFCLLLYEFYWWILLLILLSPVPSPPFFSPSTMLMCFNISRIYLYLRKIFCIETKIMKDFLYNILLWPFSKIVINCVPRTIFFREGTPRRTCSQHPNYCIE